MKPVRSPVLIEASRNPLLCLSHNLLLLPRLCPGITRLQILRLQRNALDVIFLDQSAKAALLTRLNQNIPT